MQSVEPRQAVWKHLHRRGDLLISGRKNYDLTQMEHVYIVGAGKAGSHMLSAAAGLLGSRLDAAFVVVKDGHLGKHPLNLPNVELVEAGHPIPDARSVAAAKRIIEIASRAGPQDLLIVLISGGGSSLMTLPASGVTLEELQALTGQLLSAGADIGELNTVRKHLDLIKGGGLAGCTAGAQMLVLVLSDVTGDPLDVIASGPTVADPSTFADVCAVLEKYSLWQGAPEGIKNRFQDGVDGRIPETLKPGDERLLRVANIIVGSNKIAVEAAAAQARHEGFLAQIDPTPLNGEARLAGERLARWAYDTSLTIHASPLCLVAGGETTVTVRGSGQGGRNQELALAAVEGLSDVPGALLVTLATDGGDGTTPAAGAAVTSETLQKARSLELDPHDYLDRNDSHRYFALLDDLLITGPTLTNVNDLALILIP